MPNRGIDDEGGRILPEARISDMPGRSDQHV